MVWREGGGWKRVLERKSPVSSLHVVFLRLLKVNSDVGCSLFLVCGWRWVFLGLFIENHLVVGEFCGHRGGAIWVWRGGTLGGTLTCAPRLPRSIYHQMSAGEVHILVVGLLKVGRGRGNPPGGERYRRRGQGSCC